MNDTDKKNEIRYTVELSEETLNTCARRQNTPQERKRLEYCV